MFVSEILSIAGTDNLSLRTVSEEPGNKCHADAVRLQRPWRQVDNQPPKLSLTTKVEFRDHDLEMPTGRKPRFRVELQERAFDKAHEILLQDKAKFGLRQFHAHSSSFPSG